MALDFLFKFFFPFIYYYYINKQILCTMKKPKFDYKKFYNLYFDQPYVDPTEEFMAETFNISVEDVHRIGGLLFLLETLKAEGRFGRRHDPLDARSVKRLVESEIITVDDLAEELGVSDRHIYRLCNSVDDSSYQLPKKITIDNSPEAIARAKSV